MCGFVCSALCLRFVFTSISLAIGAANPQFKAENVAKIAAGVSGVLCMIINLVVVVIILGLSPTLVAVYQFETRLTIPSLGWAAIVIASLMLITSMVYLLCRMALKKGTDALEKLAQ